MSEEALRLHHNDHLVNAVLGQQLMFFVRTIQNSQMSSVGRMQSLGILKEVVHIVTTEL
jgi:hypothetical protein